MANQQELWSPYEQYVQAGLTDGKFHNAAFTRIAAGPPRLSAIGGAMAAASLLTEPSATHIVYPIGLIQNVGHTQNKDFARIFEIGSERSYFIPRRAVGQLTLGTVYYHGPSLLRRLWAYYEDTIGPTTVAPLFPNMGSQSIPNPHDVKVAPGFENLYLNLASDLFSQPIGLMFYMKDANEDNLGAVYFEAVNPPNHTFQTDSQGVILQETVTLNYERMVPVAISALPLQTVTGAGTSLGYGG